MELKSRIRKVNTYITKLETQEKECIEVAKELMRNGNKERALIQMKKKKFIQKEVTKTTGAM